MVITHEKALSNEVKALAMYFIENDGDNARVAIQKAKDEEGEGNYLVLTDDEADEKAKQYILDSVWAFNKSFLDSHSEAIVGMDEKVYSKIQEMCESANKTILRLIDDVDHFVNDAIACDGRGHFLSHYDGEEYEVKVNNEYYYIYRQN